MSNTQTTIEWYVEWLRERNPDWTDEQRLEVATGFAVLQEPPKRPVVEPEETPDEQTAAEARKEDRKNRRYLTGKELMEILQTPGAIPKVN